MKSEGQRSTGCFNWVSMLCLIAVLATRKLDHAIFARPSSYHPGGVNVAFCDSHLKFISNQIDYYVYCLLMSSDGHTVREPGSQQEIPGFDMMIKDQWFAQ